MNIADAKQLKQGWPVHHSTYGNGKVVRNDSGQRVLVVDFAKDDEKPSIKHFDHISVAPHLNHGHADPRHRGLMPYRPTPISDAFHY